MILLFKQKSPANIIILLIFGLLIKLPFFLYPKAVVATDNDGQFVPCFGACHQQIRQTVPLLASVIAFFLLYVQALMINYLVNEYRMTTRQTYLPGMAYLLITSLLPEWSCAVGSPWFPIYLSFLFLSTLFRLYNQCAVNSKIFNIGLLAGLTSFIFFPSLIFALAIILGLMILRAFRLNEFFLLLMGAATPYYFYAAYLFLTDQFVVSEFFPTCTLAGAPDATLAMVGGQYLIIGHPVS